MSGSLRVLVAGEDRSTAESEAAALESAAASTELSLAVTATDEPASVAGPFDCLVAVEADVDSPTAAKLTEAFPEVPVVLYLGPDALSRDHVSSEADVLVQRSGDGSPLVLASRIASLVGDSWSSDRQQVAATLDRLDEAVFVIDEDWRFTYLNDAAETLLGQPGAALLGERVWEPLQAAVGSTVYDEFHRAVRTDESVRFEEYYGQFDRHFAVEAYPGPDGLVVYVRDVTAAKRQEIALSGVLEATRTIMQARTREEVGDLVARAAATTLDFECAVVRVYDAAADVLRPVGWSDTVEDDPPTYELDAGPPGEAFASGERREHTEIPGVPGIEMALTLPVGVHGTLTLGSTDGFDDVDEQVAEILATNAAVAFSRAKREQEARQARQRVETMIERINGLVTETVEVLVQATTREEIETGVTEQLTAASPYAFAWLGTADVAGETLSATAWAGDADLDVADYEQSLDTTPLDPSARALQSRERVVESDLAGTEVVGAEDAVAAGLSSLCAVPLVYKDTVYGVLTVYADRPDAFDEREQVVLEALGRAIADAINAVERGRILSTNRVVEMELASRDPDLLFSRLSTAADCRIESTGSLYQSDGSLQLYLQAETDDAEALAAILRDDAAVTEVSTVVSHEGTSLFEVTVGESVVETLAEYGAVTKELVGEDGMTRLTIELPYETEARDTYDRLAERYDDLELVAYHEHDRPVQTRQEFRAALRERFTDRQETALRSAYLGGFFEWPRDVDGDDLASAMGITRPTYHQHLRAAERKVFEELF